MQRFKYKPGVLIGQGSFGEVFTVDRDGVALACKRQSKKFISMSLVGQRRDRPNVRGCMGVSCASLCSLSLYVT